MLTKKDLAQIKTIFREEIEAETKPLKEDLQAEIKLMRMELQKEIREVNDTLKNLEIKLAGSIKNPFRPFSCKRTTGAI